LINIKVQYFAVLREQRGLSEEAVQTMAKTAGDLYDEIADTNGLTFEKSLIRAAINDRFVDMSEQIEDGDKVVFIPPVAGG
jgi:molybdopterin converting factor subunit 1